MMHAGDLEGLQHVYALMRGCGVTPNLATMRCLFRGAHMHARALRQAARREMSLSQHR